VSRGLATRHVPRSRGQTESQRDSAHQSILHSGSLLKDSVKISPEINLRSTVFSEESKR